MTVPQFSGFIRQFLYKKAPAEKGKIILFSRFSLFDSCPTPLQATTLDIQSHEISDVVPCGTVMLFVSLTVMFCGFAAK